MIPTKTYPLSAIMGEEMTDKERIAELEAEVTMRREQADGLQNQWVKDTQKIVALEAEVKMLRKDAEALSPKVTEKPAQPEARERVKVGKCGKRCEIDLIGNRGCDYPTCMPTKPEQPESAEPVAWMWDEAAYSETDVRGRCWSPMIGIRHPMNPQMTRNIVPLYTNRKEPKK